ncbi:MAG: class I SAM-dependent methyltransferase [Negativicutes bacterium]|nr:class I SAM-dependent methyltransferase [Negativicutes bacterium]
MSHAVCPWWLGYYLLNPLRGILQNPEKLLAKYVQEGMSVMDIGSGMGYFTLPLARLAGETGRVIAIDLQDKMIAALRKRAANHGLANRIEARVCSNGSLQISEFAEKIDFALAFAVIHEVPDQDRLLREIYSALKPAGRLLISEPSFHVSRKDFQNTILLAQSRGFTLVEYPEIKMSISALLARI